MKVHGSLVLYIGNGVVKGGIVAYEKNKPPRIVTSRSRDLQYHAARTREQLESRVFHEFSELVKEIKTKDVITPLAREVRIEDALVILSSPWYVSETSVVKIREQKPFVVNDKLLDTAKENIIKAYRDANKVDVRVLEQKILQISLNGYQTANPMKKKVEILDMVVFTSFARNSSLDEFKKVLDQNFHLPVINIHSQSLAAFSIIGRVWKDVDQYVLADITSELTEIVVVRKGALAEAASFPRGKKHLINSISEKMGVAEEVAVSFLAGLEDSTLDEGLSSKIKTAMEDAKKEWIRDFSVALSQVSSGASLPQKFFLFAPKDAGHFFADFITNEAYQQFSFAEGNFEVKIVDVSDFKNICTAEKGVTMDLAMTVAAMFNAIK